MLLIAGNIFYFSSKNLPRTICVVTPKFDNGGNVADTTTQPTIDPLSLATEPHKNSANALHATASDATQRGAGVDGGITTYSQDEEGQHTTTPASDGTTHFTYILKSA